MEAEEKKAQPLKKTERRRKEEKVFDVEKYQEKVIEQFRYQITSVEARYSFFIPKQLSKREINQSNTVRDDELFRITTSKTLNQEHRDILDLILSYTEYDREKDEYSARIPLPELKKIIPSATNPKWLDEKIMEIKETVIYIRKRKDENTFQEFGFNIVRKYLREWKKFGDRGFLVIVFERAYCRLFDVSVAVNYRELLHDIISIDDLAVKGVVRYCLSQREFVNKDLFEILEELGYDRDIEAKKRKAQRLKRRFQEANEKGILKKFNINYSRETNRIVYSRMENVHQKIPGGERLVEAYESLINAAEARKEIPAGAVQSRSREE